MHNIEFNKNRGTWSIFSADKSMWHNLSIPVKGVQTANEAIKLANLDYEVEKYRNWARIDTNYYECPNSYSLVRKDNNTIFADRVSNEYQIVQNTEAFNFADEIVGSKQAIFETAGALFDGRTIFVTAKLPEPIVLKSSKYEDIVDCYLLFTNSHDGSSPVKIRMTPIRTVCWNTLQAALSNSKDSLSFKHTTNVNSRLESSAKAIKLAHDLHKNMTTLYNILINHKVANYEFAAQKYIANLFLKQEEYIIEANKVTMVSELSTRKLNIINDVFAFTMQGKGQNTPTTEGTAFGLYNGITGYFTHKKYPGETPKQVNEKRLDSIIQGGASDMMYKALNNAYEITKV